MIIPCRGLKNIPCARNANSPPDSASPIQAPNMFTIVVSKWSPVIFIFIFFKKLEVLTYKTKKKEMENREKKTSHKKKKRARTEDYLMTFSLLISCLN